MNAQSRKDKLLTQEVGDELVIYDEVQHEAYRLSPTAALVWRLADGTRDVSEIAAQLREATRDDLESLAHKIDQASGEELVRLALQELDRTGLLARSLPHLGQPLSRRQWIGAAAALLPVITSIVAPTPAMAQTPLPVFGGFNGAYTGNGTPVAPNACNLFAATVTLTVSLDLVTGFGTVTIRHGGGQTFTHPCTVVSRTPPTGVPSQIVLDIDDTDAAGFHSEADLTITRNPDGSYTASGHQDLERPNCETTYNITATKPAS